MDEMNTKKNRLMDILVFLLSDQYGQEFEYHEVEKKEEQEDKTA